MQTFGDAVRSLRQERGLGIRRLAEMTDISPSYLNDIEKNYRPAPSSAIINRFVDVLKPAQPESLFDLAAADKDGVPPDVLDFMRSNPETVSLLRTLHGCGVSPDAIIDLRDDVTRSHAKAIIVAAGEGQRDADGAALPSCLQEVAGKPLIARQVDALREANVGDIHVVRGFRKNLVNEPGLFYHDNDAYADTHVLYSLFCAEPALNGHTLISYADILFEPALVRRLVESRHDIVLCVDIDWRNTSKGQARAFGEAENVVLDAENKVVSIGKIPAKGQNPHGEFIGLMKVSARGADILRTHYRRAKDIYSGRPFQRASVYEKAYLTDLIQEMVDLGIPIHCVLTDGGWREIINVT